MKYLKNIPSQIPNVHPIRYVATSLLTLFPFSNMKIYENAIAIYENEQVRD